MSDQVALGKCLARVCGSKWHLVLTAILGLDDRDYRASGRNCRALNAWAQATSPPCELPEQPGAWWPCWSAAPRPNSSDATSPDPRRDEARDVSLEIIPHPFSSQTIRTVLERSLLTAIKRELTRCVRVVRQYIPLKKYPDIYVVRSNNSIIFNEILLPDWISALTIKDTVYILAQGKQWNTFLLKKVLCHELFHAAVYRYFGGRKLIPYWFNEAVAYSLVKREFGTQPIATEQSPKLCYNFKEIGSFPENISNSTFFTLIDYISTYLLKYYKPHMIRRTLKLTKELGEFEQAIYKILVLETFVPGKGRKTTKKTGEL